MTTPSISKFAVGEEVLIKLTGDTGVILDYRLFKNRYEYTVRVICSSKPAKIGTVSKLSGVVLVKKFIPCGRTFDELMDYVKGGCLYNPFDDEQPK